MSTIVGMLGIEDVNTFVYTLNQSVIWSAVSDLIAVHNKELSTASGLFVDMETTDHLQMYTLPAGGMMQESDNKTRPALVKGLGSYQIGLDLRDGRDGMGWDDVTYSYLTVNQLDAELLTVTERDINFIRYQVLRHLLNPTNENFTDQLRGTLAIKRLANNDGTVYPPLIGTATEVSGHNHYLASGYAANAISNTNNPFPTLYNHLYHHWGATIQPIAFINSADRALIEGLAAFSPIPPQFVIPAITTSTSEVTGVDRYPGQPIGVCSRVVVIIWDWVPSGYIFAMDANRPGPLRRRVDINPALRGFQLVAKEMEFPLDSAFWRHREGYGVANRLNGVAMQLTANPSYAAPTAYA